MSSYEELKRRVAMLKQVDREETMARKAVAAQENAEVARAKATMFAKEKENDERLHAAKKALHAATERSQAMRKQYESEVKRLQQKLDVTTGKLAASEEKASRESVAAETRRTGRARRGERAMGSGRRRARGATTRGDRASRAAARGGARQVIGQDVRATRAHRAGGGGGERRAGVLRRAQR